MEWWLSLRHSVLQLCSRKRSAAKEMFVSSPALLITHSFFFFSALNNKNKKQVKVA